MILEPRSPDRSSDGGESWNDVEHGTEMEQEEGTRGEKEGPDCHFDFFAFSARPVFSP